MPHPCKLTSPEWLDRRRLPGGLFKNKTFAEAARTEAGIKHLYQVGYQKPPVWASKYLVKAIRRFFDIPERGKALELVMRAESEGKDAKKPNRRRNR